MWVHAADGTYVKAVDLLLKQVAYQGQLLVENGYDLGIQIQQVYVDKITVVSSTIGTVSTLTLKLEINNFFRLFLPLINTHLADYYVRVPQEIFGIFTLSDLSVGYFDQYLFLGMTPTFLPPAKFVEHQLTALQ